MKHLRYDTKEIDGDINIPRYNWQKYYSVRNDLLKACRPFGSVGPLGERTIIDSEEEPDSYDEHWPLENDEPEILIVDDLYNLSSTYIRIELELSLITSDFFYSVANALKNHQGWAASIGTEKFNLILFEDAFMINAPFFSKFKRCKTIDKIIGLCQSKYIGKLK